MRLWDLPGARRFIDATCDSLRGGSSVAICFPGAVPEGFDDALLATLGNALEVRRLTATVTPLEDLSRRYARHPSHVNSVSDLCDDPDFRGLLVRLDNVNEGNWPAWRDFLGRYAQTAYSDDAGHQFRQADHRFRSMPITLEERRSIAALGGRVTGLKFRG